MNEESTINPMLDQYLWLRYIRLSFSLADYAERIYQSWQRPGLHTRWGMLKQRPPECFWGHGIPNSKLDSDRNFALAKYQIDQAS